MALLALIDSDYMLSASTWGRDQWGACAWIKDQIASVVEAVGATDYFLAVGGPGNFREALRPEYKNSKSRAASRAKRPEWYHDVKAFLLRQPHAVEAVGCEADDLVRMWSVQAAEAGDEHIIVSPDKDLDCIPGMHFNPKHDQWFGYHVSEDEADAFYWQQMLSGDSVDNIPGLPGIGPVKAAGMLAKATTPLQRKQLVIAAYYREYRQNWRHYLLANGRLIHMWRRNEDYFRLV